MISMSLIKRQKKQRQKISLLDSTEQKKEFLPLPQGPDTRLSGSLHRSCKTLNLAGFKKAYCNGQIREALVIQEPATDEEVFEAWNEIITEYATLLKTDESGYLFDLAKQISILRDHIYFVDNAIYVLLQKFEHHRETDAEIIEELNKLGYDVNTDTSNPEAYVNQLNRCISLCKTNVFDLEELENQYNRLKNTSEGKKQSEEDIDANIMMLSKYQHYPIDEDKVSVYKYIIILNNFLAEARIKQKQHGQPQTD